MLYAFFTSCLIATATGDVECTNSYTEMDSVAGNHEVCMVQAARLQRGAINSVLLANPEVIVTSARYGCGTYAQAKKEAESTHKSYVAHGIPSTVFKF